MTNFRAFAWHEPCVYVVHESQLVLLSAGQVSFQRSCFSSTIIIIGVKNPGQNSGTIWKGPDGVMWRIISLISDMKV